MGSVCSPQVSKSVRTLKWPQSGPRYDQKKKKSGKRKEIKQKESTNREAKTISSMCGIIKKPSVQIKIGKNRTRALLDTGAEVGVISLGLYNQIKRSPLVSTVRNSPIQLVTADKTDLQQMGEVDVTFKIANKTCTSTFQIAPDIGHSMIIGWDVSQKEGFKIDGANNTMEVKGTTVEIQEDCGMASLARLTCDVTLEPESASFIKIKRARNSAHEDAYYLCDAADVSVIADEPGIIIAPSINYVEKSKSFGIRVVNTSGRRFHLKKGNIIAKIQKISEDMEYEDVSEDGTSSTVSPKAYVAEVGVSHNADASLSNIKTLDELLEKNKDLFAESDLDLGRTHLGEMTINTGDHPPIALKAYRAPLSKRRFIVDKIEEMLQAGVIVQSRSPWTAPVVLVSKKDGSTRFCIDYRRLNSCTAQYNYPIPHIDDIFAQLAGSCCFSTMDLKSGYHQIPMRKKDCEKTAFVTHVGVYKWVVMPFGLNSAPAVFSEVMAKVLRGIDGKFTTAYLDDILVWSPSPEAHLCHLQEVFDCLGAAGLKLKREKCDIFQQLLEYLGHYVTPEGITPCQDKVNAIVNLQPPTTPKEVRSFIGPWDTIADISLSSPK